MFKITQAGTTYSYPHWIAAIAPSGHVLLDYDIPSMWFDHAGNLVDWPCADGVTAWITLDESRLMKFEKETEEL